MSFDTLEYFRRGGRIGKAQALLGSLLKVNPVLGIRDRAAFPIARARNRTQAMELLVNFVKGFRAHPSFQSQPGGRDSSWSLRPDGCRS
jgi:fatty acid-binding protein DegV